MLPNTDIVRETREGYDGIFETAKKGAIIIDSSTISPIASREMAQAGEKLGFRVADAPVAGAIMGAINGTLTFMVGCRKEDFEDIKEVLLPMGSNFFHTGTYGTGQVAKICNNLNLAIQLGSVSESMILGEACGVDPKVLTEIIRTGSGNCWNLNNYHPHPNVMENVPSANNYEGGFKSSLMKKDLSLALDSAHHAGVKMPFVEQAIECYHNIERQGDGNKDMAYIYKYLQSLNDTSSSDSD